MLKGDNFESAPDFCPSASISVLSGRKEGLWAWEHFPGREEIGGLEGGCRGWRAGLVKKSVENRSLHFNTEFSFLEPHYMRKDYAFGNVRKRESLDGRVDRQELCRSCWIGVCPVKRDRFFKY